MRMISPTEIEQFNAYYQDELEKLNTPPAVQPDENLHIKVSDVAISLGLCALFLFLAYLVYLGGATAAAKWGLR